MIRNNDVVQGDSSTARGVWTSIRDRSRLQVPTCNGQFGNAFEHIGRRISVNIAEIERRRHMLHPTRRLHEFRILRVKLDIVLVEPALGWMVGRVERLFWGSARGQDPASLS